MSWRSVFRRSWASRYGVGHFNSLLRRNYKLLSRCLVVSDKLVFVLESVDCIRDAVRQIRRAAPNDQKVTELLNVLDEVPDSQQQPVFSTLLSALRQDGQEHVANIFVPKSDARPMSDKHYQLLVSRQQQVCQFLYQFNELVQNELFSPMDRININVIKGNDDKSFEIINIILRKPDTAFRKFISALVATKQEHVTSLLGYQTTNLPMTDEHRQLLSNKKNELAKFMDLTSGLAGMLINADIINKETIDLQRNDEMCHLLVDILLRKPDSAFDKFISALLETKQEHVAGLLGYRTAHIPMTDEHRQLLSNKKSELVKCMDPFSGLIDGLKHADVLNSTEDQRIRNTDVIEETCHLLVDILRRKPDSAFDKFISALRATKQEHVASLLGFACSEKPMTEKHRQLLTSKTKEISEFIASTHVLLNTLLAVDVFNERDLDCVANKSSYAEMSAELVNILLRKSDSSFDKFIEALNNTEQQHVVYVLTGQGESPLVHLRRLVLRKACDRFVSRVDTLHTALLPKLMSAGVLTDADKERIEAPAVNDDRAAVLVDVIARKPQHAYDKFIDALKGSGHHELAELIEGLELKGHVDPQFFGDSSQSKTNKIVTVLGNHMKALAFGKGHEICEITSLMEQNEFAVSDIDISEGSIHISFRCFTEDSLANLKRLYTDKTLDKMLTEAFSPPFADQGLESLTLRITENKFQTLDEVFERLRKFTFLPLETLEMVLMRTFIKLFDDKNKSHNGTGRKTHEAVQLAYSTLAGVCYNWWQTMDGWPQSPTKHWFKHKLHRALTPHIFISANNNWPVLFTCPWIMSVESSSLTSTNIVF